MGTVCPVFVTAAGVTAKILNRLLLHLRDWEYGEPPQWDNFQIISTRSLPADVQPTIAPITTDFANEWVRASMEDITSLMLAERQKAKMTEGRNFRSRRSGMCLVLDEESLRSVPQSVVLAHYHYYTYVEVDRPTRTQPTSMRKYEKVRVPWDEAYIMFCNLDMGNMHFSDFCDRDRGMDNDCWWEYANYARRENDVSKRRSEVIRALEALGQA